MDTCLGDCVKPPVVAFERSVWKKGTVASVFDENRVSDRCVCVRGRMTTMICRYTRRTGDCNTMKRKARAMYLWSSRRTVARHYIVV
jgi:hypothetical protein